MEPSKTEELIVFIVILAISGLFLMVIFFIFLKRKNKLIEKQRITEERFERELIETQIEIREETMRNISWELHDNIGQIMTLAKVKAQNAGEDPEKMKQAAKIIGQGLEELRNLSKIIDPETLKKLNLDTALQMEMDRFNRLRFIETHLNINGLPFDIDNTSQTIIFRVLQEFFSNTIKHAQATTLDVALHYEKDMLKVIANDNGVGFEDSENSLGLGLRNMKNRAKLIGAELQISSKKNRGTSLSLVYPKGTT